MQHVPKFRHQGDLALIACLDQPSEVGLVADVEPPGVQIEVFGE